MKDYGASITYHQKNSVRLASFSFFDFKRLQQKAYFLHYDIWLLTLYTALYLLSHQRFDIFSRNYAASLSIKIQFYETINYLYF